MERKGYRTTVVRASTSVRTETFCEASGETRQGFITHRYPSRSESYWKIKNSLQVLLEMVGDKNKLVMLVLTLFWWLQQMGWWMSTTGMHSKPSPVNAANYLLLQNWKDSWETRELSSNHNSPAGVYLQLHSNRCTSVQMRTEKGVPAMVFRKARRLHLLSGKFFTVVAISWRSIRVAAIDSMGLQIHIRTALHQFPVQICRCRGHPQAVSSAPGINQCYRSWGRTLGKVVVDSRSLLFLPVKVL